MKQQLILIAVLIGIVFGIGYYVGRKTIDPSYEPEIKYVDRYLPPVSKKYDIPSARMIYLPIRYENTRIDTIRIPKEITKYVVADPLKAINVKPSTVSFTYYDPTTLRYNTSIYNIPQKKFKFEISSEIRYFPQNYSVFQYGINATAWWNKVGVTTGIEYNTLIAQPMWSVGIKYKLIAF